MRRRKKKKKYKQIQKIISGPITTEIIINRKLKPCSEELPVLRIHFTCDADVAQEIIHIE